MQSNLTEAGVFGGIGGFQEAARREGIQTKWISEIDNYRQNILKQHFKDALSIMIICTIESAF